MTVKRYDYEGQGDCSMGEWPDGPYVRFEDYQKLEADIARIRSLCETTVRKCQSRYSEWEGSRRTFAKDILGIINKATASDRPLPVDR